MLLTVGRHIYYKGYEYLLAAFARVRADAVLVMIGSGPLTSSLKRQAIELGIESRVLFTGEVDHGALVAAYHRCDVFTLPSIEPSEAFGMASAEAMGCGKPTVVCELGNGVNYLNRSGLTSLTVPPRDVAALSNAIEALLGEPALRRSMGENAQRWVRTNFSSAAMAAQTAALYRALV
jgi:rhamnosyl/mannosyltransferase